jgi:Uncharacterized protein conserved in bacteria
MKQTLIATGLFCIMLAGTARAEQSMLARVTVYWAQGGSGSDKWTRNHQAATRVRLRSGHCAVDPQRIPYGSRVTLPDGTLVAVDTGKHVRSRRAARRSGRSAAERNAIVIDRFFETKTQALRWARTNPQFMMVRVHAPNESIGAARSAATSGRVIATKAAPPLNQRAVARR